MEVLIPHFMLCLLNYFDWEPNCRTMHWSLLVEWRAAKYLYD